jgi:TolB-like protein
MARDEAGTLARIRAVRKDAEARTAHHQGRIVDNVGDNFMAEFASVVNATHFAVEFARALREARAQDPRSLELRIGIHVGDVLRDDDERLYGDAVIVAARITGITEPGAISVSSAGQIHLAGRDEIATRYLGEHVLKNVDLPVGIFRVELDPESEGTLRSEVEVSLGRPAIVVLPFDNMSSDPDQEFLVDGLVEDLTTALAASSWFAVIARNSAFAYKGRSFKVTDVSKELGARYIVEGSVRRSGNRLRVAAQLIDGNNGHHIWADRYDRDLNDLFAVQDELTEAIAAVLIPSVAGAERTRALAQPDRDLDAWASLHRGMAVMGRAAASEFREARRRFQRAAELAPSWGLPHAMEALSLVLGITFERTDDAMKALQDGLSTAERGVRLAPNDAEAHHALGWIAAFAQQYDRAGQAFERGIALNSSMAGCYHGLGFTHSLNDRPEEAIPLLERCILLSPRDSQMNFRRGHLGQAHFQLGHYAEALAHVQAALDLKEEYGFTYLAAAIHGMADNLDEGRSCVERARTRFPENTVETLRAFLSPSLYALHVEGLTRLGEGFAPVASGGVAS